MSCLSDTHLLMGRGTPARSLDQAAADSPFSPLLALQVRYSHFSSFLRTWNKAHSLGGAADVKDSKTIAAQLYGQQSGGIGQ